MRDLFQYVPGSSLIHRLNPITKLLLTIGLLGLSLRSFFYVQRAFNAAAI